MLGLSVVQLSFVKRLCDLDNCMIADLTIFSPLEVKGKENV